MQPKHWTCKSEVKENIALFSNLMWTIFIKVMVTIKIEVNENFSSMWLCLQKVLYCQQSFTCCGQKIELLESSWSDTDNTKINYSQYPLWNCRAMNATWARWEWRPGVISNLMKVEYTRQYTSRQLRAWFRTVLGNPTTATTPIHPRDIFWRTLVHRNASIEPAVHSPTTKLRCYHEQGESSWAGWRRNSRKRETVAAHQMCPRILHQWQWVAW